MGVVGVNVLQVMGSSPEWSISLCQSPLHPDGSVPGASFCLENFLCVNSTYKPPSWHSTSI